MATTPEPSKPEPDQERSVPPSKWHRLLWFVGLWGVSVFVLWVISWVIRWAVA